jgi:hypothetical protein
VSALEADLTDQRVAVFRWVLLGGRSDTQGTAAWVVL